MSKDTEDKLTPEALKHMMLDHMSNTMPIPVDRDYAEHLLNRLIKSELTQALKELEKELNGGRTFTNASVISETIDNKIKELEGL